MDRFLVRLPKKRRTGHDSDPTEAQNGLHQEEDKFMRKKIVKVDSSSSVKESSQPRQSYLEFGSHKQLGKLMTCQLCGMSYIEDNEEDCQRHEKHCKMNNELKLRAIRVGDILDEENDITIVQISIGDILSNKKSFAPYFKAITKMYEELGGCIDELDGQVTDSFALFYFKQLNILAVMVVELISRSVLSRSVRDVSDGRPAEEPHLCLCETCNICPSTTLGIRQMWVRSDHRGNGINFYLLEMVRKKTFSRLLLSREHVAFSQPTEDGKRFISRYTNTSSYWTYSH